MIVFVTLPHHRYTVAALAGDRATAAMPRIESMTLGAFLRATSLPAATYILCDAERMTAHERRLAGEMRALVLGAGLPCLNDPLAVPTRHGLLLRLHAAGLNPFRAWRAEDLPRPARFPVFLRADGEHGHPIGGLIADQPALEAAIAGLPAQGHAAAGVLVVEFCAEPLAPGRWRKFGTFGIGAALSVDHAVIEDGWCVKYGTAGLSDEAMIEEEYRLVEANHYAAALRPAFALAGIEWGRADHATVGGREVVYEINTNPHVAALGPQRFPRREDTLRLARARMARLLADLDSAEGEPVPVLPGPLVAEWREKSKGAAFPWRP
jgi:hypothetical protein